MTIGLQASSRAGDGPLLELRDVRTHFQTPRGVVRAVDGVSLTLERGRALGIVGESGSGKTILSRSIMGLLPPRGTIRHGGITFEGREIGGLSRRAMRDIWGREMAMIFQDPMTSLNPLMKIGAQIAEPLRIHLGMSRADAWATAERLMQDVRIPAPGRRLHQYPHELSGGMRQRIMIAIAMSCGPTLLLADEPTTALDVTVQAQVLELLLEIQRDRGLSILLVTHDMGVAAMVADRIAVMYAGRLVEEGDKESLFAEPRHPYTVGLIAAAREAMVPGSAYYSIPGAPPNLLALPPGCSFAPRCAHARPACNAADPPLRDFGPVRAACVLEDRERPWLTTTADSAAHA